MYIVGVASWYLNKIVKRPYYDKILNISNINIKLFFKIGKQNLTKKPYVNPLPHHHVRNVWKKIIFISRF